MREGLVPTPNQYVKMRVKQRPSINAPCLSLTKSGYTTKKILPVSPVPEDLTSFNSPAYHVMQGPRRIQSWLSRHDPKLYPIKSIVNNNLSLNLRPPFFVPLFFFIGKEIRPRVGWMCRIKG
jgi:hypothetical protein